jgi:hypothetical protein
MTPPDDRVIIEFASLGVNAPNVWMERRRYCGGRTRMALSSGRNAELDMRWLVVATLVVASQVGAPALEAQVGFAARVTAATEGVQKGAGALDAVAKAIRALYCGATLLFDVQGARNERTRLKDLKVGLIDYEVAKQDLIDSLRAIAKTRDPNRWPPIAEQVDSTLVANRRLLVQLREIRRGEFVAQTDGAYKTFLTSLRDKEVMLEKLDLTTPSYVEDYRALGKLADALEVELESLGKVEAALTGYMNAAFTQKAGCSE